MMCNSHEDVDQCKQPREDVPGHIHFTERPKRPLAAGSVGVRWNRSILKYPGSVL